MSGVSTTDDSTATTETVTAECGHDAPREDIVSVPELGGICRDCHTPIPLRQWDDVIDGSKTHHMTGETSHYKTWLVGLDEHGRALYHDERRRQLLVVVPKYHPDFRDDVTGDERPLRKTPPRHAPTMGKLINAPDNGVLVAYDHIDTESDDWCKKHLCEIIAERAARDGWDAVSETALERLEYYTGQYDADRYRDDVFPVEEAREVLQAYSDD